MKLHLAPGLELPPDAITQTFGILAVRGAGKSNAAAVMAEQMFKAKLPFVVVDPVGAWWGLRSSADGTGPGLPIPIFGGAHGDIPLEKSGGQAIADTIAEQRLSCVIDVSDFGENEKRRFLADFAERLYRKNREPLHLFLEEADDYIPQRASGEVARVLGAFEAIVRRGRARGLGITMISQRSAVLNKNVLTQIETLIVLRTTSPQDRKAIAAWVEYHGQAKELLESLPALGKGEAWVWSPAWLQTMKRVQFPRRSTFDSGATPKEIRGQRPPATLADVDLGALQKRMSATIEKAKAEDPKELRRRIGELERELAAKRAHGQRLDNDHAREIERLRGAAAERVEVPVITEAVADKLSKSYQALGDRIEAAYRDLMKTVATTFNPHAVLAPLVATIQKQHATGPARVTGSAGVTRDPKTPASIRGGAHARLSGTGERRRSSDTTSAGADLSGPEQRILDGLAWLEAIGVSSPEQAAVAFMAGYSPGGGAFQNPRGSLRSKGLIEYAPGGRVQLTEVGRALAAVPDAPLTPQELQARVLGRLPGPEQRILKVLLESYPEAVQNDELAQRAGYEPRGGAFQNPRGRLRSLGLIEYPRPGAVVARPLLFLEGA